jgi:hypothetical protein
MSEDQFNQIMARLLVIESRLLTIEASSPPRASTVQPLVGPPERTDGEPAALARPAILAELKTFIECEFDEIIKRGETVGRCQAYRRSLDRILKRIEDLDQGPIAQCPVEYTECELYMSQFKKN